MSVADFLEDVGKGLESGLKTTGRVAKAVAPALGKSIANEEAGYAPQIAAEGRARQYQQEDQLIAAKEAELTRQLETGRKYGTLTPEQQQQYVDQITGLYSHPRHAATLMEKLRQAVHPQGAIAGPPPQLKDATPAGGTAAADEQRAAELAQARYTAMRQNNPKLVALDKFTADNYGTDFNSSTPDQQAAALDNYVRHSTKGSVGKSPPLPGTQLPPDAMGPDGQPIGPAARDAAHSFVQYNGSWWPVAQPKPILRQVGGDLLLIDPQSHTVIRKLASANARMTTRQTMQPGDDGQMHIVNLTSVSTPEGATIEVDPEASASSGQSKPAASTTPAAPKKNVASVLKPSTTGAKPVGSPGGVSAGKVVPGLSGLAERKLQTTQDRQVLESSKQIISAVDDLLPVLEKHKTEGGALDAAGRYAQFEAYKHGVMPSDPDQVKIFENAALLGVVGASIWSRIGRSKYTFEVIQQHLPKPTDTPQLMYDKVKWLKEHVVPAAQDAIKNPQPDSTPVKVFNPASGKLE